jgi:hypothetical protein
MRLPHAFHRQALGRVALVAWFVVMVGVGAGLLAKHVLPFRTPEKNQKLEASLERLRTVDEQGRWLAIHVLYADCRCSARVADHLASTVRPAGWDEMVLWVGDPAPSDVLEARFDVRRIRSDELAALGIEAAPLLVALDPGGHVHYAGGYTDRKQGPVIDDRRLLAAARGSDSVPGLPVFGCAVSSRLQNELAALPTP